MDKMGKDFLNIIVEKKKEEIAASRRQTPEKQLRKKAESMREEKRLFHDALTRTGKDRINIIAEIKRASPSKGDIRRDLDPCLYAKLYEKGGAAALSVLTDTTFFKGSFEDFKKARKGSSLPMLRKDFLISAYQIFESAVLRADAILLIAKILNRQQLKDYLMLCKDLNLDALVEIHDETDLENATWAEAKLIGINNRNLSSFETDIHTATRLVPRLESYQTPVAASGIASREDILKNRECGISNFLIGESLIRADDPAVLIRSFINS
jgi:indole-3-glycerol phosphate synthase